VRRVDVEERATPNGHQSWMRARFGDFITPWIEEWRLVLWSEKMGKPAATRGSGHDVAAAHVDAGGGEGAVRLLGGGGGRDGGTRFQLAPIGDLQTAGPSLRHFNRPRDRTKLSEFYTNPGALPRLRAENENLCLSQIVRSVFESLRSAVGGRHGSPSRSGRAHCGASCYPRRHGEAASQRRIGVQSDYRRDGLRARPACWCRHRDVGCTAVLNFWWTFRNAP
jgi:hypothetical protein